MTMPGASGVGMRLMVGRADGAPTFSMRHFRVEPGGHTPLHHHNYEHEVLILEGQGLLVGNPDAPQGQPLKPGDVVFMPANEPHQFRNQGQGPLRFMCMVPTRFDCGGQTADTPGS